MLEKSDTAKLTKKFINKLRERDYARDKGNATQCDSVLMEEFYKDLIGKEGKIIFKNHSYVKNRYFLDNKEKYSEKNPENNPVIFQNQDLSTEDRLKLPIFDCFVSRYVYHTFTRWLIRFGQYLRVVKDE